MICILPHSNTLFVPFNHALNSTHISIFFIMHPSSMSRKNFYYLLKLEFIQIISKKRSAPFHNPRRHLYRSYTHQKTTAMQNIKLMPLLRRQKSINILYKTLNSNQQYLKTICTLPQSNTFFVLSNHAFNSAHISNCFIMHPSTMSKKYFYYLLKLEFIQTIFKKRYASFHNPTHLLYCPTIH